MPFSEDRQWPAALTRNAYPLGGFNGLDEHAVANLHALQISTRSGRSVCDNQAPELVGEIEALLRVIKVSPKWLDAIACSIVQLTTPPYFQSPLLRFRHKHLFARNFFCAL